MPVEVNLHGYINEDYIMNNIMYISLLMCVCLDATAQPSIVSTGSPPGAASSSAFRASPDGQYVVGDSFVGGDIVPFVWSRDDGLVTIEVPTTGYNYTGGTISHDGRFVTGTYSLDGGLGSAGYVWSQETGVIQLGSLPGGNMSTGVGFVGNTSDFAIGSSTVGYTTTGQNLFRPVKWTFDGGLEELPIPTASDAKYSSYASYILNDGRIFISANSGKWLWSEDAGFEHLPGASEGMRMISANGDFMAGESSNHPVSGFAAPAYWTRNEGVVHLPILEPDDFGQLYGMNDDGSVIVGKLKSKEVIWINQGRPILIEDYATSIGVDMTGWNILGIWDISEDGSTIVGQARFQGRVEGFVLTIPAPPSVIPLAALGLWASRRRRSPGPV